MQWNDVRLTIGPCVKLQYRNEVGVVHRITEKGDVRVEFKRHHGDRRTPKFTFHPAAVELITGELLKTFLHYTSVWENGFLLRLGRSCHQMFSAVLLSQSIVSSLRAAKPNVPFGGWHREQEANMWSAVCSSAPHLQLVEDIYPHLCIVERKSRTLIRKRFSQKQKGLGKV